MNGWLIHEKNGVDGNSTKAQKAGQISQISKGARVNEDGILGYLIYIVGALVATLLTLWNTHIMGRIGKVEKREDVNEKTDDSQWKAIHGVEMSIAKRFAQHEIEERDRDAVHAAEVSREFKDMRKEMNEGHAAILEKVNEVAKDVRRNGNGRA